MPLWRAARARRLAICAVVTLSLSPFCPAATAQESSRGTSVPAELYRGLRWRCIGPFRGGRTKAGTGVQQQPGVFYVGAVNGGVWKSDDYGRTWTPIFDDEPTGSIGAIAVAPSDPNVLYVGSGEGLHRPDLSVGDGIYRSTDGGKTWTHLGLRDGQQIPQIAVDPHDPNRLLVAVAGHPYGPNEERGIFLSMDGGSTFRKTLYKDENTGASDVVIDPVDPRVAYAALWEAREGPWENGAWNGTGGGIYKSTDGGETWQPLAGGLPEGIVQANLTLCRRDPNRLYAAVAMRSGVSLYRSDDAGQTWRTATTDPRPAARIGGGDLPVPRADPTNPDTLYIASTVTWKTVDGGKTWTGLRGAPGGDDYQNAWISPQDPGVILLTSDQGAIVSVNGGRTWSSWYNQPTAQLYHVSADNAYPYRLLSGQQESGSVAIASRGSDGEITVREWHPVAAEEYGYVAADPLDPDIVYGGKLTRYDRRTGQAESVSPKPLRGPDFRALRTEPVVFSPHDPHTLYFASNVLWQTRDGGRSWKQISPDLSRKSFEVPATVGKYRGEETARPVRRGVIYSVAPSPLAGRRIWAGTDDGLIHLTTDGGTTWTDVTPPGMRPFQKVSIIEASYFDPQTAYAAINALRLDDLRPHIYRTRDSGRTWTEVVQGIPIDEVVNVVREDTERKGLLFAGTERAVYVSFDDGDRWQPLRLNMPATSVRDLAIKGDDLAAATHGRGFWILDDITPLRQLTPEAIAAEAILFRPQVATRIRWDTNTDTPLPPDTPAGENPPDGAVIDYYLRSVAVGPVTLEIRDGAGKTVRRYSSADPVPPIDPMLDIPAYWVRPPQVLSGAAGMHRFLWDLHYTPLPGRNYYPISAVPHNTAPAPTSPWVMPGGYTVVLTVEGRTYTQPLRVRMDPRVKTSNADLQRQFQLSWQMYTGLQEARATTDQLAAVRRQLVGRRAVAKGDAIGAIEKLDQELQALAGTPQRRFGPPDPSPTFANLEGQMARILALLQESDAAPTPALVQAAADAERFGTQLKDRWHALRARDLSSGVEHGRGQQ